MIFAAKMKKGPVPAEPSETLAAQSKGSARVFPMQSLHNDAQEGGPLTLHVALISPQKNGFVWVTDRLAVLGLDGYATVDKITYLKDQRIACSIWGDGLALHARDQLIERIKRDPLANRSSSEIAVFLTDFGTEIFPEAKNLLVARGIPLNVPRGILLAVLGETPRLYRLDLCWPPVAVPIVGQTTAGDESNPALIFTNYYYEHCQNSLEELLFIGIHTVRFAERMNTKGIRGVDAWVCEGDVFRQLNPQQLTPYVELSHSLDVEIFAKIAMSRHLSLPFAQIPPAPAS
jgi:hypothetical protein